MNIVDVLMPQQNTDGVYKKVFNNLFEDTFVLY